jgi:hypothetical protein
MIRRRCFTLEIKKILRISLRKKTKKTTPDDQLAELLKEKGYPIAEEPQIQRATGHSCGKNAEEDIRLFILYFNDFLIY